MTTEHAFSTDEPKPSRPAPSLSIVMPVYNAKDWAPRTLARLDVALADTPWRAAEVIVVDDGSTDGTGEVLDELAAERPNLSVVHTPNQGRLLARRTGLEQASGDLVLLIDCRVFLDATSLQHVAAELQRDPTKTVWNGHVVIDTTENPYARFWEAVTFVAWRRYLANPRPVSFGADEFDHFPKGTGCFLAPRSLLLESYDAFESLIDDVKLVNDDTSLLRHLAAQKPIHIDPGFSCVYHARGSLRTFLTHAHHRGVHFVDGYLSPKTRFFVPLVLMLAATPVVLVAFVMAPAKIVALGLLGLLAGFVATLAVGVRPRTAAWFTLLAPAFAIVYGAGIWRGVALILSSRARMAK